MNTEDMIPAAAFCMHHNIEMGFINSLSNSGLIEMTFVEEECFISLNQIQQLEKMVRLYYEMEINVEGIEAITHLLHHMHSMQLQIMQLSNRLALYEER